MVLREPRDDGVSPVVGMILVLGISVVGIAAILYWGLPAIDEMKANVEHKSVESQFIEFDSTVKELVAGTTEKTAKRWLPTLNRGAVLIMNETEGWVYATEMWDPAKSYNFEWIGFGDGDHVFAVRNAAPGPLHDVANFHIVAERVNTTTSITPLHVSTLAGSSAQMPRMALAGNGAQTFYLWETYGIPAKLGNSTIRFRIYDDNTKIAEAVFVPTGVVEYRLEAGLGKKTVVANNGAVLTGNGDTFAHLSTPPIPAISETNGVPRFFGRAVILNGTGSFAGSDRFDVLVTLYSTSTLANYDCAVVSQTACVESAKVFNFGQYEPTWRSYLTNAGRGYAYTSTTAADFDGEKGAPYLIQRSETKAMGYTLLQSRIQLRTAG